MCILVKPNLVLASKIKIASKYLEAIKDIQKISELKFTVQNLCDDAEYLCKMGIGVACVGFDEKGMKSYLEDCVARNIIVRNDRESFSLKEVNEYSKEIDRVIDILKMDNNYSEEIYKSIGLS